MKKQKKRIRNRAYINLPKSEILGTRKRPHDYLFFKVLGKIWMILFRRNPAINNRKRGSFPSLSPCTYVS